ncbi:MAG: twin-arginine translocase TatA/TatE family subunit [Candidatus Caldarchaeum sp.]|nr:twin-arginine translocase TatA/TatE family subunit [Candidatus Caldarchaeum sp.]MDW8062773.1 twin-arginine translocase TatA/TatE family subunit [Candidatus Caldarchaeum sp.]
MDRAMAIQGIEWIIVAVVILILFLWGPDKLPKIARSIGQAKKEFEKAQRGLEEDLTKAVSPTPSAPTTTDDKLLEVAKALNIPTEGKTRDEIARAIVEKSQKQN